MFRLVSTFACLLFVLLLSACNASVPVENLTVENLTVENLKVGSSWMEEKPTVIPLPAIPVTPTVTLEAPVTTTIHALDLRPLTNTVPVTQMIPITPHFVTGCNAKVALSKLPSSSDTIVLAGLAQTISSTKESKYLAADVPLILYRAAEHGGPVSSEMCPQPPI